MDHPASLLTAWRQRAQFLSDFGDSNSAKLWRLAAVELEEALKALGEETLTARRFSPVALAAQLPHEADRPAGIACVG